MKDMVHGENILFDSLDVMSIKKTIKDNLNNEKLIKMSKINFLNSKSYTWNLNIVKTMSYLKSCKNIK